MTGRVFKKKHDRPRILCYVGQAHRAAIERDKDGVGSNPACGQFLKKFLFNFSFVNFVNLALYYLYNVFFDILQDTLQKK